MPPMNDDASTPKSRHVHTRC